MWQRPPASGCRIDGRRRIAHERNSAPFSPKTSQATLDLRP
jgi:hypothetical protein